MHTTPIIVRLSESQIDQLFLFTKKKFVHWYDLQIEIVDHLATCIEEAMTADATLSFDSALEGVYKKFGIFGFAKIVQERQLNLEKSIKLKWWEEFRKIFRWPNFMLLFGIVELSYLLATHVERPTLYYYFLICYSPFFLYYYFTFHKDTKIRKQLLLMQNGSVYVLAHLFYDNLLLPFLVHGMSIVSFTLFLSIGIVIKIVSLKLYLKIRKEAQLLYPKVFTL